MRLGSREGARHFNGSALARRARPRPRPSRTAHRAGGLPRPAAVRAARAAATQGAATAKVAAGGAAPLRLPQLNAGRRRSGSRTSRRVPRTWRSGARRSAASASAAGCRARRPSGGGSGRQRRGERHDCRGHRRGFPA